MSDFEAWRAICETKARYCRCLDSKDWEGYADVFTPDLILDTRPAGGTLSEGRDAALATVRAAVETAKTAHQVHNPEMDFAPDGQSADVIWAMNDRVVWNAERAPLVKELGHTGYGQYREHYVKCDDGRWRIKHQVLSYLTYDSVPLPGA